MFKRISLWISLFGACLLSPALAQNAPSQWTFLMFMNADTNLEENMMRDIAEIAAVGSNADVNILVQVDRGPEYESELYGNWTDTRRFYVTRDIDYETEVTDYLGEQNMGDPAVLADFLRWGISNYPAEKYALFLSNHGGGWSGLGPDETDYPGTLSLDEMASVLDEVLPELGVDKLELIAFDACLMSQIDVLQTIAPYARYALASEELVPGDGFEYTSAFSALEADPQMDGAAWGQVFVDGFMAYYDEQLGRSNAYHLFTLDLAGIEAVTNALAQFSAAVQANPRATLDLLGQARANVQMYDNSNTATSAADLRDLMSLIVSLIILDERTDLADLASAAQGVINAVDEAVVNGANSDGVEDSYGISVYFPFTSVDFAEYDNAEAYTAALPAGLESWLSFLNGFHAEANLVSSEGSLGLTMVDVFPRMYDLVGNSTFPPVLMYERRGAGIINQEIYVSTFDDPQRLISTYPIANWVVNEDGRSIASFGEGYTSFAWDTRVSYLYGAGEGERAQVVVFSTNTSDQATVSGTYLSYYEDGSMEQWPADLVLDSFTGGYEVSRITAYIESEDGIAPFELDLWPGDQFIPDEYYWVDGVLTTYAGEQVVTFGSEPLRIYDEPVADATYEMGVMLTDIGGNRTYDYLPIDVQNEGYSTEYNGYVSLFDGVAFATPYAWGQSTTRLNADGTTSEWFSNDGGTIALYLTFYITDRETYPDAEAELVARMNEYLDAYTVEREEVRPISIATDDLALALPYRYTTDDGVRDGVVIGITVEENLSIVLFDLDYRAELTDEALAYKDVLLETFYTFPYIIIKDYAASLQQ